MNRTNRALLAAIFCCFSVCTLCATVLLARYLPQTDASSVEVELPSLVGTTYAEGDERLPPSLYEVVFDKVGTKKLMATYAKLKKIL